jgi:hypothetical protein
MYMLLHVATEQLPFIISAVFFHAAVSCNGAAGATFIEAQLMSCCYFLLSQHEGQGWSTACRCQRPQIQALNRGICVCSAKHTFRATAGVSEPLKSN